MWLLSLGWVLAASVTGLSASESALMTSHHHQPPSTNMTKPGDVATADFWESDQTYPQQKSTHGRNCTSSDAGPKQEGFINGFVESLSVILVSEIGDKTFFIAAILAMQNNKLVVFLAAVSALFLMTILSGLLGWVATQFIPREYTYWTCTAIMILFGLKMLWESWRMDSNEAEEVRKEVELELGARPPHEEGENNPGFVASSDQDISGAAAAAEAESPDGSSNCCTKFWQKITAPITAASDWLAETAVVKAILRLNRAAQHRVDELEKLPGKWLRSLPCRKKKLDKKNSQREGNSKYSSVNPEMESQQPPEPAEPTSSTPGSETRDGSASEKSWFGKTCFMIFKLFLKGFTMTFIAEWGDRSQLATIVLVGLYDVGGVIVGGCIGHFVCTGVAVLCGALIARFISVRMVTFLGALVFLGFAIASIFTFEEDITPELIYCQVYNHTANITYSYVIYDDYVLSY